MDELLNKFKELVIKNCDNKDFVFHEWFVSDHLLIVERLALELCEFYPDADKDIVQALVWFHDFGKPIDIMNERDITRSQGTAVMREIGFPEAFITKVLELWELMEQKETIDISQQPIEVQIMSSADGGSHFVGKFFASYFRDDPEEALSSIVSRLDKKMIKDWERKIVLPEMKKAFERRYRQAREIIGEYPERFI